ncbi:MAG: aspartate-semialdehyde dehydrogenase [Rickettsiales bacterium]|jgi:aspartate-semialdehyde dehydrogenase|nr:aspartate-semialdehyde dehydrogenase [Rickettsiales bacterium]
MGYNIAVVGATGNVGRELLAILDEREFPIDNIYALASERSIHKKVTFGNKTLAVHDLAKFDFSKVDIGLFSPGGAISKIYAPKAAAAGCIVIDNTSHFRMDKDIPLIIPEVNRSDLKHYTKTNIISNPNCSTIQMLVALKPLHDFAEIKRIVVSTYQSVSGAGKSAMDELFNQTKGVYENKKLSAVNFTKPISFNVIPHIDVFMEDGNTKEEWKMINETKKILGSNIEVSATCVRCPIFVGHAESINIEFNNPITEADAFRVLSEAEGIIVSDRRQDGGYMTPKECVREDEVFISRLRTDPTIENGLNLWCVADNLRKGAALNTIQIAECLVEDYISKNTPIKISKA